MVYDHMGGHKALFESKLRTTLSCSSHQGVHPSIEGNVVHTHVTCTEHNILELFGN